MAPTGVRRGGGDAVQLALLRRPPAHVLPVMVVVVWCCCRLQRARSLGCLP